MENFNNKSNHSSRNNSPSFAKLKNNVEEIEIPYNSNDDDIQVIENDHDSHDDSLGSSHDSDHSHDNHHHLKELSSPSVKNGKHGHSHGGGDKGKVKGNKHGHSHGGHSHNHDHDHDHDDHDEHEHGEKVPLSKSFKSMDDKKKARYSLILALILTTIFMVGEIIGGWVANSLAIMTDAAHLLTDIGAMLLSLFAMWIANRPPTSSLSFGFHRAEILGALASVLMIWLLTGILIYEGIQRIINPPDSVNGKIMFIIACGGLFINILDAIILHWGAGGHGHSHGGHSHAGGGGHSHQKKKKKQSHSHLIATNVEDQDPENKIEDKKSVRNINVHSAYIHVLGDCFQSIGVMIASALIWIKPNWKIADPITTFIFSIIVLMTTIQLLKQSLGVLMEAVPSDIKVSEVREDLLDRIPGVSEVHDLHIWSITLGKPALSVHLTISPEVDSEVVLQMANKILDEEYSIKHTTIQIEKPTVKDACKDHSCPPPTVKKRGSTTSTTSSTTTTTTSDTK